MFNSPVMALSNKPEYWQLDKGVLERNKYMFLNKVDTDITFIVGYVDEVDSQKVLKEKITAHRYILTSSSPVFWSMFCGEISEEGYVTIPDIEPQAFTEMLRYLYYEEAKLCGDYVMQILYISKKYMITGLTKLCIAFLKQELQPKNVCIILEQCSFFEETELTVRCMETIKKHTENVLKSEGFLQISQMTLCKILEDDELTVKEVEIVKACLVWAEAQLQKNDTQKKLKKNSTQVPKNIQKLNKEPTYLTKHETVQSPESKPNIEQIQDSEFALNHFNGSIQDLEGAHGFKLRQLLGSAFFKIRFTNLSLKEFVDVVVPSGMLTNQEELLCFKYISQTCKPKYLPFPTKQRTGMLKSSHSSHTMHKEIRYVLKMMFQFEIMNKNKTPLTIVGFDTLLPEDVIFNITLNQFNTNELFADLITERQESAKLDGGCLKYMIQKTIIAPETSISVVILLKHSYNCKVKGSNDVTYVNYNTGVKSTDITCDKIETLPINIIYFLD